MEATVNKFFFGEWLPDLPFYENPGLVEARNAVPVDRHYKDYLPLDTTDDTLGARCQGAFAALDSAGNTFIYAGNSTLLSVKSGTSWTELSGATYNTATDGYWRFAQYDEFVVATNYADVPQAATIGSATFGALSTSGTAPSARHVGVVGQFVVLGDTNDAVNGVVPHRIAWSGIDAPRNWPTPGSATATAVQSGEQFLYAGAGAVTGIFGSDQHGVVGQKTAITRMSYVGGDVVFQFDTIDKERGFWFPNAAVQVGSRVFFIANDGFYVTDGVAVLPIGSGKVDKYFFADCDQTYLERVRGAIDYENKCVVWCYPTVAASSGQPNRLLYYNYVENRWGRAEDTLALLFPSFSDGYTLDQLDSINTSIDAIGTSFDSTLWQGGVKTMMGFGTDNRLGTFSGTPATARFETGEFELNPLGWARIDGVRPMITGNPTGLTVALAARSTQDNESRSFGTATSRTSRTGICDFRQEAKFASARIEVTGGFDRALGIAVRWFQSGGH